MSSAQRELLPEDEPFALKEQVAARLAAHRARRGRPALEEAPMPSSNTGKSRSARIAEAVAERYAHSQSYREFMADEAEKAIREAEAQAEIAARSAKAVAEAQYELLAELDEYAAAAPVSGPELVETRTAGVETTPVAVEPAAARGAAAAEIAEPVLEPVAESVLDLFADLSEPVADFAEPVRAAPVEAPVELKVRFDDEVRLRNREPVRGREVLPAPRTYAEFVDEDERMALEEEIAFRQSPVFEEIVAPVEIPANLIEFPRQLVAPRRARPRLAEGPLREEAAAAGEDPAQLRIFEVEAEQISTEPAMEAAAPEWSSIVLSPQPEPMRVEETPEAQFMPEMVPQTAPMSLRLMAGVVDLCLVSAGLMLFVAAFAATAEHFGRQAVFHVTPQLGAGVLLALLVMFGVVYQMLFFTFGNTTPGMLYAQIGLCTLDDDNPTREAMRKRVWLHLLSLCPLGMGYLWAMLDEDKLGWHDRVSKMYQRGY